MAVGCFDAKCAIERVHGRSGRAYVCVRDV